jgi:ABC-type uncharacterized transport system auxiliary subunit
MSVPSKRYFQILILETEGPPVPKIEKTLYLEPVRVDPLYDDTRIVYRVSPFEIKYYAYAFWAKRPDALFREAIADFFDHRSAFRRVTIDVLQGDPELLLRSNIRILEEVDGPNVWQGRLAMSLEFMEFKTGQSLLLVNFDKKMELLEKQVRALPAAISQILREELVRATVELSRILEEKKIPLTGGR